MLELLPWLISAFALLLAVLPLPGLKQLRLTAAIFALGAGQIYLAVLGFAALLVIDNNWRIVWRHSAGAIAGGGALLLAILMLTLLQPTDLRTWSELAQLGLYIILFLLVCSRVDDGRDLLTFLRAAIHASLAVALLALVAPRFGWTGATSIFVDRGANEASVFLALLGVVPCAVMLSRTRNPAFLGLALLLIFVQYLATSRGSMAVSVIVLLAAGFLWTQALILRAGIVVAGLAVMAGNVPQLMAIYDGQLNFSARERIALFDYGAELAGERFWTGWGWGSTSRLASAAPNTAQNYPHFHNAFVQMVVELGALGWFILAAGGWLALRWLLSAGLTLRQPGVTALVSCSVLGIITASMFDAMLFGADRSIQLIVLLALCSRAVSMGMAGKATAPREHRHEMSVAVRAAPLR